MPGPTLLATVVSRVKGHHEYRYPYRIGERISCNMEINNIYSRNAIVVKSRGGEIIGHMPDGLSRVIFPLVQSGKILRIEGKILGDARSAPEGTWIQGGGIEIPCKFKIYGKSSDKRQVCNILKNGP